MSSSPQLIFQIRPEGYATLTIEAIEAAAAPAATVGTILDPPLRQAVLQSAGVPTPSDVGTLAGLVASASFSRPWASWLWNLKRFVSTSSATGSGGLTILAPSVDETDIGWYGTGSVNDSSDPVTFTATLVGLQRFGPILTITSGGGGYGGTVDVVISSSNGQGRPTKGTAILDLSGIVTGWTQTSQGYNLASPLVVTFTGGGGSGATATATLGRQFAVGDFIVWNDATINGGGATASYSYEIDQITEIVPVNETTFTCTLARAANGAASGGAQYGSMVLAHGTSMAPVAFYRLINKEFFAQLDITQGPQVLKFPWDNMTVAAVTISGGNGSSITINLAPAPYLADGMVNNRAFPPAPGLRTMNGAAYTNLGINGTIIMSATAAARVCAQAWESLRTIYAKVLTAPVGATPFNGDADAAIVIYVCYIAPLNAAVGLIDTLVIDTGEYTSYSPDNVPDGRQMPYHALWQAVAPNLDWPPNVLPELVGALTGTGQLKLGFTISTTGTVVFAPDGAIDFIVAQAGSTTAGANLTVAVQT